MSKPLLLDAFSCAAIGAEGYAHHFEVVCLDNDHRALKHAAAGGFHVVQGDAIRLFEDAGFMAQFDAIHASPPCQLFSATRKLAEAQGKGRGRAVDLLTPTLDRFATLDVPWVVENVERSPLRGMDGVVRLCGSMFGLKVQRHRLFLSNIDLGVPYPCAHWTFDHDPITGKPRPWGVYCSKGDNIPSGGRTVASLEDGMAALGVTRRVPWKYLCEALPPAMTDWVGGRMIEAAFAQGDAA